MCGPRSIIGIIDVGESIPTIATLIATRRSTARVDTDDRRRIEASSMSIPERLDKNCLATERVSGKHFRPDRPAAARTRIDDEAGEVGDRVERKHTQILAITKTVKG